MLNRTSRDGFSLVEVVVALTILSVAVLGLSASVMSLTTSAASAELKALALEAADDRIVELRMDPRYASLDTLYSGTETGIVMTGGTRVTTVTHVQSSDPPLDFKRISVTVTLPHLPAPISRQIVVAAP